MGGVFAAGKDVVELEGMVARKGPRTNKDVFEVEVCFIFMVFLFESRGDEADEDVGDVEEGEEKENPSAKRSKKKTFTTNRFVDLSKNPSQLRKKYRKY